MGRGHDTAELENLSRQGHGRFYLVEDATRLPAVFAQETVLAARSSIREQEFHPAVSAPDVVTRGIDFAAGPPLRGWVVTIPKPRASILLTGPDNDPILASWQVGVGRVAAFMSDAKDRWGANWLNWPEAQRLWGELARSLVRRADPLVRVDADTTGGVLHVHADARTNDGYADSLRRLSARVTGPDGQLRELALDPVGAGTYGAEVLVQRPGAYAIAVRDESNNAVVANGGAMLMEGEELRPPTDPELLDRIISMTGGRARSALSDVFRDRMGLRRAYTPLGPFLLYLAALAMFLALVARRLVMPEALVRALEARRARARAGTELRAAPALAAQGTVNALLARKQRGSPAGERAPSPPDAPAVAQAPPPAFARPPPVAAADRPARPVRAPAEPAPPADTPPRDASETGSANLDALLARKRQRK
jgi:hypothetical protein